MVSINTCVFNIPSFTNSRLTDEDGGHDDSGQYEQWAEAMDPNANVTARPVPQAVVDALPLKVYATVKTESQSECLVCRYPFEDDQTVVELACGHFFCAGECIELWLTQSDSCPTCRGKITSTSDSESKLEGEGEQATEKPSDDTKTEEIEGMVENLGLEEEDVAARYGSAVPGAWGDGAAMVDSA